LADQKIGFGQLTWDKSSGVNDLLFGVALRYNYYDDNTAATGDLNANKPDGAVIPSIFIQDEIRLAEEHNLLLGLRYDNDKRHGSIYTPRLAYKWNITDNDIVRFNTGTGFRVVNLFTEEHASLTGARKIVIAEELKPERSMNLNLNYLRKFYGDEGTFISVDASVFYTHFGNRIIPDYDTDPNMIIYGNLNGASISKGLSANLDVALHNGLKILIGATFQDVTNTQNGIRKRQILTESYSATWSLSYDCNPINLGFDYTGNLIGPMRLPLLGPLDPRREYSPIWSIQNIQITFKGLKEIEIYTGIKNLLNWTPNRGNPFIIARANDPFDRNVVFNENGQVVATADNPYALSFDPSYVYGPNQGIRGFLGLRYRLDRF
jgi:outer membrane receptor for ferrienterochelin and colicins